MIDPLKLVTRTGFLQEYWRILQKSRENGSPMTSIQVYSLLEMQFLNSFGETQFPSFDAFRKYRDTHKV